MQYTAAPDRIPELARYKLQSRTKSSLAFTRALRNFEDREVSGSAVLGRHGPLHGGVDLDAEQVAGDDRWEISSHGDHGRVVGREARGSFVRGKDRPLRVGAKREPPDAGVLRRTVQT